MDVCAGGGALAAGREEDFGAEDWTPSSAFGLGAARGLHGQVV